MLEVEKIDTYYGLSHILFGVSLKVEAGQVVCLLGRNGAGKTTTLKSILGLAPPKQGRIRLLAAVTEKDLGYKGISSFLIDLENTPGFRVGTVEEKLGINASGTAELVFEDARIPQENLLGKRGEGFKQMLTTLDGGRIGIASQRSALAARSWKRPSNTAKPGNNSDGRFRHSRRFNGSLPTWPCNWTQPNC